MTFQGRLHERRRWLLAATALMVTGMFVLFFGKPAKNKLTSQSQTVHITLIPETEAPLCPVISASARLGLVAALQEEAGRNTAEPSGTGGTSDFSKRKPVRVIRDPYYAYSSVAVDPTNDEVVLTDENLFNIVTYNRTANTPPAALLTEPKRVIGGEKTRIEFQCGLYIDPTNGDIYAVNNDTVNSLIIFSRQAKGDVPPDREVETPHGTFGIAVDEQHQELMLTIQHDAAVVTFRKSAASKDSPVRLLQGDHTLLQDPHGLALDTKHDVIFVSNHGTVHYHKPLNAGGGSGLAGSGGRAAEGRQNWPQSFGDAILGSGKNFPPSITVYPRAASGDTAPLRVIQGPKTRMDWPTGIAYSPKSDELFVANDMGDEILVFPGSAKGDVAPSRIIRGPKSHIKNPTGVYVDLNHDELWVANFGNHSATVYRLDASGDAAPLRMIRSGPLNEASLGIGNPHPVGFDTKRSEILVPNCVAHPQIAIFDRMADGTKAPVRKIEGQKSLLGRTMHSVPYDEIHDEFTVPQEIGQAFLTFRGAANGEEAPIRIIQGPLTQILDIDRLATDPVHNEIFVPQRDRVLVFPREGNGNIAPIRILQAPANISLGTAMAVDPIRNLLVISGSVRGGGGRGQSGGGGEGGGGGQQARLFIFNRTDEGTVAPKAAIGGPKSQFRGASGPFTIYAPKGYIITGVGGGQGLSSDQGYVGVWSINDNGDIPPRYLIGGPGGVFQQIRGVTVDAAGKGIIVSDKRLNAVMTFSVPEIF